MGTVAGIRLLSREVCIVSLSSFHLVGGEMLSSLTLTVSLDDHFPWYFVKNVGYYWLVRVGLLLGLELCEEQSEKETWSEKPQVTSEVSCAMFSFFIVDTVAEPFSQKTPRVKVLLLDLPLESADEQFEIHQYTQH